MTGHEFGKFAHITNLRCRRRVKAPYEKKGLFTLMQGGHTVVLKTTFGVKIIWDGNSYVEVTVPPSMKGTLCGLCGA